MNWRFILAVYLKELKDSLRDRRTLISTIVIPTVIIPLLTFGLGKVMTGVIKRAREEIPSVAIMGGTDSPGVVEFLKKSPKLRIVPTPSDYQQALGDKKLRVALQIPDGFEAALKQGTAPTVKVLYHAGEMKSEHGATVVERCLGEFREQVVADRLAEHALARTLARPFEFRRENAAPSERVGGNLFGGLVPYLIIILCFSGAMYPAMDLTAGEKERGTMETLLCSPVARVNIVLGKFLMVLTGSLSAMVFMLISMGATAAIGGSLLLRGAPARAVAELPGRNPFDVLPTIDPFGLLGVLVMVFPVAVLFAALAFTTALFAKSYKEAQSYLAPFMLVVILPAAVGTLPGIDLNSRLALVPLLNLSLVCKEMLSGVWHWSYIALIFGSSCVYAAVALAMAVRMFNREDVLFRT